MQTQFKKFIDCKEHDLFRYGSKLYYKIPVAYYIDAYTGEIGWIDGLRKVEVIAQ